MNFLKHMYDKQPLILKYRYNIRFLKKKIHMSIIYWFVGTNLLWLWVRLICMCTILLDFFFEKFI